MEDFLKSFPKSFQEFTTTVKNTILRQPSLLDPLFKDCNPSDLDINIRQNKIEKNKIYLNEIQNSIEEVQQKMLFNSCNPLLRLRDTHINKKNTKANKSQNPTATSVINVKADNLRRSLPSNITTTTCTHPSTAITDINLVMPGTSSPSPSPSPLLPPRPQAPPRPRVRHEHHHHHHQHHPHYHHQHQQ